MSAAVKTGYDYVRLSALLDTNARVDAGQDELLAVPADLSSILDGQPDPRSHTNPSGDIHVTLGSFRVFINRFP